MSQQEHIVDRDERIGGISTSIIHTNQSIISNQSIINNGQIQPPVTSMAVGTDVGGANGTKSEEPLKNPDGTEKIKRPMNPFMIFGCEKRKKLSQVHPRMHNSEMSKILGAEWKRMSEYEKAPYKQEAKRLKEKHSIEHPNYKFKANRRKPRQAVRKERPSFPYATADINSIPAAMKFPYPSPFFPQESMYVSMYPAAMATTHPAYASMYSDYSSVIARQAMSAGSVVGRTTQTPSTSATVTADYYALAKGESTATPVTAEYYPVVKEETTAHPGND